MNISRRFSLGVLLASIVVLVPMSYFSYQAMFGAMRKQIAIIRPLFSRIIEENIVRQNAVIETVSRMVVYEILAEHGRTPEDFARYFSYRFQDNDSIFGIIIALTPDESRETHKAWYFYKDPESSDGQAAWVDMIAQDKTPYFTERDWFSAPYRTRHSHWTKPYYGRTSDVYMVTFSMPIINDEGRFLGVVACDISLDWIDAFVSSLKLPGVDIDQLFLLDRDGTVLADKRWNMLHKNIFKLAAERGDVALAQIAREMTQGQRGEKDYPCPEQKNSGKIVFMPIEGGGEIAPNWSLGVFIPTETMHRYAIQVGEIQVAIGLIGILLLVFALQAVSRSITRPIRELKESALGIAAGNLEAKIPGMYWRDELAELADAFSRMQEDLKSHIASLAEATRAKEQMESELRIGHEIQMSLVPSRIPKTPYRERFDLAALMEPARQVGGDFYDYFMLDEETLCLVVADVSGKGVPAALLMSRNSALFRGSLMISRRLAFALERINHDLCRTSESGMFITLFALTLHLPSGECQYVNAGHNPPFLVRKRNGSPEMFEYAGNLPLGVDSTDVYEVRTLQLEDNDLLFLYTDGANEAFNAESELFGEKRLGEVLSEIDGSSCETVVETVRRKIADFARETPRSDDITLIALRWRKEGKG